jgi:hypothetical protein
MYRHIDDICDTAEALMVDNKLQLVIEEDDAALVHGV